MRGSFAVKREAHNEKCVLLHGVVSEDFSIPCQRIHRNQDNVSVLVLLRACSYNDEWCRFGIRLRRNVEPRMQQNRK